MQGYYLEALGMQKILPVKMQFKYEQFFTETFCAYHHSISLQEYLFATRLFAPAASITFIFLLITETPRERPKGTLTLMVLILCEMEAQRYRSKLKYIERYLYRTTSVCLFKIQAFRGVLEKNLSENFKKILKTVSAAHI